MWEVAYRTLSFTCKTSISHRKPLMLIEHPGSSRFPNYKCPPIRLRIATSYQKWITLRRVAISWANLSGGARGFNFARIWAKVIPSYWRDDWNGSSCRIISSSALFDHSLHFACYFAVSSHRDSWGLRNSDKFTDISGDYRSAWKRVIFRQEIKECKTKEICGVV